MQKTTRERSCVTIVGLHKTNTIGLFHMARQRQYINGRLQPFDKVGLLLLYCNTITYWFIYCQLFIDKQNNLTEMCIRDRYHDMSFIQMARRTHRQMPNVDSGFPRSIKLAHVPDQVELWCTRDGEIRDLWALKEKSKQNRAKNNWQKFYHCAVGLYCLKGKK